MTADVDVLIPIHSPSRPLERTVSSVLSRNTADIRVIVVAHGTDPEGIRAILGTHATDPSVSVVPFADGVASPAGPLSHGLDLVTAPWFAKLDSDDTFAPGAIDSWLRTASATGADIVIPRMRVMPGEHHYPTPPRRPFRRVLNPVHDRLAYRTSTMGLLRASLREKARPTRHLSTGEDIVPSLRLWFGDHRIVRAESRAEYVVGDDAGDRVTECSTTITAQLGFVAPLLDDPMWSEFSPQQAAAVVIKLIRVHVLGAISRQPELYDEIAVGPVALAVQQITAMAPNAGDSLSRHDVHMLHLLSSATGDVAAVRAAAVERRRYLRINALLTQRVTRSLQREAPLRFLAASTLAAR